MTEEQFGDLLALGHEIHGVEFKGPGSRTNVEFFAKVVRAILGMANHRGGGLVIVGVADAGTQLTPKGISAPDLSTWTHDDLTGAVSQYADPYVEFHSEVVTYKDVNFVVIKVEEFAEVPVLCKKDFPKALRAGGCYVRSRGKPETSEIPNQAAMRELIDIATEKRLRSFLGQAHRAGLLTAALPSDSERYDQESSDFR